jgi:CelD/BcsL family acetyltransferase involved in cellulose biosynthesis
VQPEWDELAGATGNVFATWEWAAAWRRHLQPRSELTVVLVRRPDGSPRVLLPLYAAARRPARVLRFIGAGPADELGPLCALEDRPLASELLRGHARQALPPGGLLLAERLWRTHGIGRHLGGVTVNRSSSPVIPIAGRSFEDYLLTRSRNFRSQARRHERRLAREHRLEYRLTTDPDQLERDMDTLIRLHEARWREGESRAFAGPRAAFHRDFARRALARGWLRLWTMRLDGEPVAVWYGLRYSGVETYYQAGRNPLLSRLHIGFVLLCHTVRSAFEDSMEEYRFGLGGEEYKSRFADLDPGLETVAIPVGSRGRLGVAALRVAIPLRRRVRRLRA